MDPCRGAVKCKHVYVVNSKPDLLGNIGRAIGEGLRALAPAVNSSLR
jgi:hypothetical protein